MKKLIIAMIFLIILVGCNVTVPSSKGIEVGEGEFIITPQDFIDRWNNEIIDIKEKNPDDKEIQQLAVLPDYGEGTRICNYVSVYFYVNEETGNIKVVTFTYDSLGSKNDALYNFGYICGRIAYFFKQDTKLDLSESLGIPYNGSAITSKIDGNVEYEYQATRGLSHSIRVKPAE